MYEEISLKQCIQEIMSALMFLPITYFEMIRQKGIIFKQKCGRFFEILTMDRVSDFIAQAFLMIPLSIVIYSVCYITLEFKTVRL